MSNLEDSAKKSFWVLASSSYAWQLMSWIFTIFTIRFLSPEDYGLMSMIGALTPYLGLLATCQLASWAVQRESFSVEEHAKLLPLTALVGVFASICGFALAPVIQWFFEQEEILLPIALVAPTFFIKAISTTPEAYLRREFKFGKLAACNITGMFSMASLQLFLAYSGFGFWALVYGYICNEIVRCLMLFGLSRIKISWSIDKAFSKEALNFGLPAASASLMWIFYSTADDIFVGRVFGTEILGFYTMAFYLVTMPASKLAPILKPVLVSYYSRIKEDYETLKRAYSESNRITCLILFPMLIGLAVTGDEAIQVLLGEEWSRLPPFIFAFIIVGLLRCTTINFDPVALSTNQPKLLAGMGLISSVLMPALVFSLGLKFGIIGVFAGWYLYEALYFIIILTVFDRKIGLSPFQYVRAITPALCLSLFMGVVVFWVGRDLNYGLTTNFIIKAATGVVVYTASLRLYLGPDFLKKLTSLGIK